MIVQLFLHLQKQTRPVGSRLIHLVDKKERRNLIFFQQPPQRLHVALHAVRSAYEQHRIVKNLQRPLHFRRKIHMPRRIDQSHFHIIQHYLCLFGKDRDAACTLHCKIIQKRILMIHAPKLPYSSGQIQNCLRKCRFSGIYMGKQRSTDMFLHLIAFLCIHKLILSDFIFSHVYDPSHDVRAKAPDIIPLY